MRTNKGLIGLLGASLLASAVNTSAENLNLTLTNSIVNQPLVKVRHIDGASEGNDIYDSMFLPAPSPTIDFFSKANYNLDKLKNQGFPLNSFTTVTNEIWGRDLSGTVNAYVKTSTTDPFNDDAFTNKYIYGDLYSVTNGVRADLLRTEDLKAMASTNGTIPLTVTNGHCYDLDVRFTPIVSPVLYAPSITGITNMGNGNVQIGALVSPGYNHILNESTNVYAPNWVPVATNTIPFANDTNQVNTSYSRPIDKPKAFFRVGSYWKTLEKQRIIKPSILE